MGYLSTDEELGVFEPIAIAILPFCTLSFSPCRVVAGPAFFRSLSESFEALFSPATAASGSAQTTPNESLLLGYLRLTMQSLPRSFLHLFIFEIRFQIANVTSPDLARRVSLGKVRFNFNWSICNDVNDINCSTNWGGCKKAKRLS